MLLGTKARTKLSEDVEIVVARFKEDVTWLRAFHDHCVIYNKGPPLQSQDVTNAKVISLPNIGREAHTYLHHIVKNYDRLADITIFIQGSISDHLQDYKMKANMSYPLDPLEFISTIAKEVEQNKDISLNTLPLNKPECDFGFDCSYFFKITSYKGALEDSGHLFGQWFVSRFVQDFPFESMRVYMGALFAVHKSRILSRPKEFYADLLSEYQTISPEIAHFMERSWYYVFHPPHPVPGCAKSLDTSTPTRKTRFLVMIYGPCEDDQHNFKITSGNLKEFVLEDLKKTFDVQVMLIYSKKEHENGVANRLLQEFGPNVICVQAAEASPSSIQTGLLALHQKRMIDIDYIVCVKFSMLFHDYISQQGINIDVPNKMEGGLYMFPFRFVRPSLDLLEFNAIENNLYDVIVKRTSLKKEYSDSANNKMPQHAALRWSRFLRGF